MNDSEYTKKYCHACQAELPIDTKVCPYCGQHQQNSAEYKVSAITRVIFPFAYPATRALLVIMIIYFIIICADILMHPDYGLYEALLAPPGDIVYRWGAHLRGEFSWWRLVTANFVHFGLLHILFNGYAFRMVSPYVERSYGSCITFASYFIIGVGSMMCSNILGGTGLVAGASGSIMGFIGLAATSAHREHTPLSLEVRNSMLKWAAFVMAFGLIVSSTSAMGIDNIAHASGFLIGAALGFILPTQSTTGYTRLWIIRMARIALIISLIIFVSSLVHMSSASVSDKYQSQCITDIKLKSFERAQTACGKAYDADKTVTISYHYYILINIINGHNEKAQSLCTEGRKRFRNHKQPLSFDEMCRSIKR